MKTYQNRIKMSRSAIGATALGFVALSGTAYASSFPGNAVTLTNKSGNTKDLFSYANSGNTINVLGDLSGGNVYYINGVQLVGFRALFITNTNGTVTTGVSTSANGGVVTSSLVGHATFTYPIQMSSYNSTFSGFTGYDDGASGKGYPTNSHWVELADPSLAGKTAGFSDTSGSFTFSSSVTKFDIGLDYILKGGQTARGYFTVPESIESHTTPVPETSTFASFTGGFIMLGFIGLRGRRRFAAKG